MNPIVSAEIELVPATLEIVSADLHDRDALPGLLQAPVGDGWPPPLITPDIMLKHKEHLRENGANGGWGAWYILLRNPRTVIGLCGFKSIPTQGRVEMGYTLLPQFHGRGLGTQVVGVLAGFAFGQPGVDVVFAETLPELFASQRVLQKNGFKRVAEASEPGVIRFELRRDSGWKDSDAC